MRASGVSWIFACVAMLGCEEQKPITHEQPKAVQKPVVTAPTGVQIDSAKLAMFAALPDSAESKTNPATEDKVGLGRMLWYDSRLSKSQAVSCNSCHGLDTHGADGKDFSVGDNGKKMGRNTPTIYDAALSFAQFWDGHFETVEDAVKAILLDPAVMGQPDEKHLVDTLKSMPAYVDAFKKAFPDDTEPVTLDNTAKAIGAFNRKLVTPGKWDQLLKGDKQALTDDEKKGFLKFVEVGCPTCHVGPLVGGTMYQKLGKERPWPNQADKGRSGITKSPSDDMMFKVSSLRDVEHTGPYFHDASGKSLTDAVKSMAAHQLAKDLSDDDVKSIVTWLGTLTGTPSSDLVKKPELPPSTATTPKPAKK